MQYAKGLRGLFLLLTLFTIQWVEASVIQIKPLEEKITGIETKGLKYQYKVELNIYMTAESTFSFNDITDQLIEAQRVFDSCKIKIEIRSMNQVMEANPWLTNWETIEFENGDITNWEKTFFTLTPKSSAGVLYVKSLDWSIDEDGIVAAAYSPFYLERGSVNGDNNEQSFYRDKMVGHSVLGNFVSLSTLAHELGHSILNLKHLPYPNNIMYTQQDRAVDAKLSEKQCEYGVRNSTRLVAL